MKLFYGPNSPYARKVIVSAMLRGIDRQIALLATNPYIDPPDLIAVNPLRKVPCLVTDDGVALYDSPVIVEYLDSIGEAAPLIPVAAAHRWAALRNQALADGINDAAIAWRREVVREDEVAKAQIPVQLAAIERALGVLEAAAPGRHLDIGVVAVGTALGYRDLRLPTLGWHDRFPALAAWFASFNATPAMVATRPPG